MSVPLGSGDKVIVIVVINSSSFTGTGVGSSSEHAVKINDKAMIEYVKNCFFIILIFIN
jgi:hypothetical protein